MEEYAEELPVLVVSSWNSGPLNPSNHLADPLALSGIESNSKKMERLHFNASMAACSSADSETIHSAPLVGASETRSLTRVAGLPNPSQYAAMHTGRTIKTLKPMSKLKFVEVEDILEKRCKSPEIAKQATHVPKIILANHPCPVCDQVCVSTEFKKHVLAHMNVKRGKKKYTCPVCDRSLLGKFSLKRHMMLIHNSVEPYECSVCDRTFTDRSSFTKHEQRHGSHRR